MLTTCNFTTWIWNFFHAIQLTAKRIVIIISNIWKSEYKKLLILKLKV